MQAKRVLYLGYYLKQLDRAKFNLFLEHVCDERGISRSFILKDILRSVFRYNISILEYFQFRFFELDVDQRRDWAGTGHMYEYQLKMNPKKRRDILDNKTLFYKYYSDFFVHEVGDIEDLEKKPELVQSILTNRAGKVVFKVADGKCGAEVEIKNCNEFDNDNFVQFMKKNGYNLAEEFIIQHPDINRLSPSAVNTIRVYTQLNKMDEVNIIGCRLRISVSSPVDNMAAGNLAAPLELSTGVVNGPAVYSDITKDEEIYHPVTKEKIVGFKVPFWEETIEMVTKAASLHPQNRSIGWDVVITEKGPGLIEGNHDWCKLLWQLPVKKGLKPVLDKYEKSLSPEFQ